MYFNTYNEKINNSIFEKDNIDLNHVYIDGTKITANANKYSWCGRKIALKTVNDSFKAEGNRRIRLNKELTSLNREVIENLNSTHGALLRMNRSIQAEGAYGTIKWNRSYIRAR